jgi:hypothetical protein
VATTTIRVDVATHQKLLELSQAGNASLMETVRDAAEALRRQRFAEQVRDELAALRADADAWAAYLRDADSTDVGDGVD